MSEASQKRRQQPQQQLEREDAAAASLTQPSQPTERPPGAEQRQQQRPAKQQGPGQAWWHERRRQQQRASGMTQLEEFMRDTPGLNRLVDGTLILGDAVMVLATEVASERVPVGELPYLAAIAVFSWILAGAALGDYKAVPDPDDNPLSNMLGWPVVVSIANACITWAVAMVPSMLGYSFLTVLELKRDGMLSPQLEVSVAMLITLICWRGMATRMRMRSD
ncbi:hypothetical protein MNEG_6425 [Monoraphidium neglectum]|uniref:Uncharacterized protein n=1 Tax=Monoraphidium neglectum TaxID=145388 RepID=A0A0D2N6K2_9CHLO|nr:hypothetical protein MNEG_6425 [Monoraphidium neglectum]KIZ01536.1 hypothetical protein MNEG_6425 [Monoraphidium neglectum]|eukprot:XP_013900555.1 hypothetical protein MNEG_6425 [Monoraphidium neglectum]